MFSRKRVAQFYPLTQDFLFVVSYGSQGYSGSIQVKLSYITTDDQPASLSRCQAPISEEVEVTLQLTVGRLVGRSVCQGIEHT
jgi:hypothetical protein